MLDLVLASCKNRSETLQNPLTCTLPDLREARRTIDLLPLNISRMGEAGGGSGEFRVRPESVLLFFSLHCEAIPL